MDFSDILSYILMNLIIRWPELIISIIGVTIAGLITLRIAKWQFKKQNEIDSKKELERVIILLKKMINEIDKNIMHINYIFKELLKSDSINKDYLNWLTTLTDYLSWTAYEQYLRSELQCKVDKDIDKTLDEVYYLTKDLYYMVYEQREHFNYLTSIKSNKVYNFNIGIGQVRRVLEISKPSLERLKKYELSKTKE